MRFPFTGVIPVDKPPGATSRGVVDAVARSLGMKTVGHAGTLDPLAAGVVVVCVGHATKLVDFLHGLSKRYEAVFLLGRSSPSDDLETPVEEEPDPRRPTRAEVEAALPAFRGEILQRPCDYSAVHVDGKRAYRLARKGREFALPEKPVRIDRLEVTGYDWPRLALDVECSTGTFIRALGRDLAAALGTRAVMESLVRTAVVPFTRAASLPLTEVSPSAAAAALLPAVAAVPHLPRVVLAGDLVERAARGGLVSLPEGAVRAAAPSPAPADAVAACDEAGALVGILRPHPSGAWRLKPNFRSPVTP
ncbi:MAG: tRNA pseudouridine(55) synthase TruB [Planctomycetota bacterium]